MAQTIKLRRSATAGAEPTTSQLELGEVAINTHDGKMYIKKSAGGTESIVEISGGGAEGIFVEYLYTATASQTAFSGNDDNSAFLSYEVGAIQIFLNGILLDPETDYTATNGALVTLSSAAAVNDYLQIFAFKKKIGDGNVSIDTFSGNNSTTAFTLSLDPGDENNTRVFIDGVYQSKSNYTVSGTTLTFSSAPPSGTSIEVEIGNRVVTLDTLSDLDLPDNVKLRLGTSQDLEIYHDASDSLINDNGTGSLKLQTGGSTKLEVTSSGVDVTGNIAVSGTVDGIDIAARDAVLTSTTTTAGAALPKAGGAMTGAITTNSTFDGRDVATDGSKLDGIEAGATADQTQSEINALGITATGLSGTPAISVANITTTGELRGPASFVVDPAAVGDNTGTVIIKGNLQVDGATTTINSTTLTVDDLNLTLASGAANGTAANGAGITIDGASATLTYQSTGDKWAFNKNVGVTGTITTNSGGGNAVLGSHLDLGDNQKARFGAGDDLQIYHDGSNSFIDDAGTGNLQIRANAQIKLQKYTGENMFVGIADGAASMYYDNAQKIATTATGINVTGTVVADGLTVDTSATGGFKVEDRGAEGAGVKVTAYQGTTNSNVRQLDVDAYQLTVSTGAVTGTAVTDRMLVSNNGDISFYEDTGTAAKFFWDASAERLGIGTSSPAAELHIENGDMRIEKDTKATIGFRGHTTGSTALAFRDSNAGVDRMTIDSSGNLLVGKTAPTISTTGVELRPNGQVFATQSGNYSLLLNRTTSDGAIAEFRKDNTAVGSIGTNSGYMVIGSPVGSDAHLLIGNGLIHPATSTGATKDDAIDIGGSSNRFKDLYLSGTATTGDIYVGAGSATSPSVQMNDTNSGLFAPAGNTIAFSTAGGERMRIDSSGNVGLKNSSPSSFSGDGADLVIGTTSGDNGLSIISGTSGTGNIYFGDVQEIGTGSRKGQIVYGHATDHMRFATAATERMRIDSSGNVGIGNVVSQAYVNEGTYTTKLRVGSDTLSTDQASAIQITGKDSTGNGILGVIEFLNHRDNDVVAKIAGRRDLGSSSYLGAGQLDFSTDDGNGNLDIHMSIDANGNVGIGTNSPVAPLHVYNPSGGNATDKASMLSEAVVKLQPHTTNSTNMLFAQVDNGNSMGIQVTNATATADWDLSLSPFGGNVGIGETSPDGELHVKGTGGGNGDVYIERTSGAKIHLQAQSANGKIGTSSNHNLGLNTNGTTRVTIDTSGKVLIGDTASHTTDLLQIETPASGGGHGIQIRRNDANNDQGIGHILFGNNTATDLVKISAKTDGDSNAGDSGALMFSTQVTGGNLTERLRIDSSGNVGIGTDSPDAWLQIEKDNNNSGNQFSVADTEGASAAIRTYTHNGDPVGLILNHYYARAGSGYEYMRYADIVANVGNGAGTTMRFITKNAANTFSTTVIDNNGNVGIGTDAPAEKLEVAGTALVENAKLKAIAESNTDTAVDVFVYDTRKDSDGGAWRKRTQNTSWYNETLNTSTRGARKEFPCVAVIVAEAATITIYDGDDPDMPMWMVFNGSSIVYQATRSSVAILNGIMFTGGSSSVTEINFLTEFMGLHQATAISQTKPSWAGGIVNRNDTGGNWTTEGAGTGSVIKSGTLVNQVTNDVAMTVLPNAPIDADTGLPVPTIAVATNGGVSVIRDDGSVVDITVNNASYTIARRVNFLSDNSLGMGIGVANGVAQESYYIFNNIPTSDNVITVDNIAGTVQNVDEFYAIQPPNSLVDLQLLGLDTNRALLSSTGNSFASNEGLSVISRNVGAPDKGLISYIASDYNTGWMHGDIKLATLSDTDTTNVTGSELVSNNSNFSNTTGYIALSGAGLSVVSSKIRVVGADSSDGTYGLSYPVTTVVGKTYVFNAIASATNYWAPRVGTSSGGQELVLGTNQTGSGVESSSLTFKATGTTTYVSVYVYGANHTGDITSFSVRLAEQDRSVNNNGVQVFGTITKTAVATGANLVGYSGFSSSNYLQQPYNSDLDFGTGDFSFMTWFNLTNISAIGCLVFRGDGGVGTWGSQPVIQVELNTVSVAAFAANAGFSGYDNVDVPISNLSNNTWHSYVLTRAGGMLNAYLDGRFIASVASTRTLTNTAAFTRFGERPNVTRPLSGSMALTRFSATAPTAEQIAKMYNDEKFLFQENAKATLYGSSNAVTALAYDDDTELLHVGTSAGRSVFQGLNRVDNTTDAVGAAISASNGFIVED